MWGFITLILLVASTSSFIIEPEDEILKNYKTGRALLTPEQEEFLLELLAVDETIIADELHKRSTRGIVDDVLQALAGVGNGNIRVNIIGGGTQPQQQQPGLAGVVNPTFTLVSGSQLQNQQSGSSSLQRNVTFSTVSSNAPQADINGARPAISPTGAPIPGFENIVNRPQQQPQQGQQQPTTTLGGNNNHLFSTISSVIVNSNRRNVTGIVDESLRIATPAPIREFVTGILGVVYCNSIRRLLGRC